MFDDPGVDTVIVEGPFMRRRPRRHAEPPARSSPADRAASTRKPARRASDPLALARRAYRRPVTDADVETLARLLRDTAAAKGGFERASELGARADARQPGFLFRIEQEPQSRRRRRRGSYRISDFELASRLSFFLWSSIPDDELLEVAERGKLKEPAVLEQQVRRMLADPRAEALVDNFAGQWLQLRNVGRRSPIRDLFPDFDDNLRDAFQQRDRAVPREPAPRGSQRRRAADRRLHFVNERLAQHYGIPNVYGSHFRRVTLPDDRRAAACSARAAS